MTGLVNYKITFPVLEFEAIHAKQAILDAIQYFKNHMDDHLIEWEEVKK